jgi:hypothetical protein
MELTRDIGRGNHDGKGRCLAIRVGREITRLAPALIDSVLKFLRGIGFGKLFSHFVFLSG